jgi:DNA-binding NarL/FixJ family response regulator
MTSPKSIRDPQAVKVVIVEDKTWLRENLEQEINQHPQMRCLKTYPTAELAIEDILNVEPDVVIMDINLPNMDGVECVRRIKALRPELRCMMLTVYEEADKIFNSLLAGASGYLLKRSTSAELLEAIQQVNNGGSPMSSSIARKVVDYFNQLGAEKSETDVLSPREQQVLELLARGAAYKDIADQLSLSIETIRMNVKHIYAKLHVHSRGEAAAKYLRSRSLGNR